MNFIVLNFFSLAKGLSHTIYHFLSKSTTKAERKQLGLICAPVPIQPRTEGPGQGQEWGQICWWAWDVLVLDRHCASAGQALNRCWTDIVPVRHHPSQRQHQTHSPALWDGGVVKPIKMPFPFSDLCIQLRTQYPKATGSQPWHLINMFHLLFSTILIING